MISLLGELLGAVCSCIDPLSELVSRLGGDVSTRERDGFGWLACVFDRLQQDASLSSELPALRRLPLVPLSDGRWSSAEQGAIYLLERGLEGLETCVANVDGLRLVHPALVHELTQKCEFEITCCTHRYILYLPRPTLPCPALLRPALPFARCPLPVALYPTLAEIASPLSVS